MMMALMEEGAKKITPIKSGIMTADGSEQTLIEYVGIGVISGKINLREMEEGDTVVIRQYVKLRHDGDYNSIEEETYVGVQKNPVVYIIPTVVEVAMKVTIQQTTGSFKNFEYIFVRER